MQATEMYPNEEAAAVRESDPDTYLTDALDLSAEMLVQVEKAVENLAGKLGAIMQPDDRAEMVSPDRDPAPSPTRSIMVQRVTEQREQMKRVLLKLSELDYRCRL